jgi:peptidoglycan hydrolase CwlO-like protein
MRNILIIALIACFTGVFAQVKTVTKKEMPGYAIGDTIYLVDEAWVQEYREEVKQRANQINADRKVEALKEILHRKRKIEPIIDSLVRELDTVTAKRDSLQDVLRTSLLNSNLTLIQTIERYEVKIHALNKNILFLEERMSSLNRRLFVCYVIILGEVVLILL